MKIRSILCAVLALLMLASVPCMAAEAAFSKYKTIPTEHGNVSEYVADPSESPLYQKTVAFFGDSLCYARIERGTSNAESVIRASGYAGRIATKYDMGLYALGVSGSTIARSGNWILSKMEAQAQAVSLEDRKEVDYVILEGGVNDITAENPIGTVGNETDNFDTNTLAGAVQKLIVLAQELYPNAQVGFLIMYQMPNDTDHPLRSNIEHAEKYMNVIIEACEKWKIPYLDFFHDEKFNDEVFKVNTADFLTTDGVHMSVKGYDTITPYIINWMEDPIRRQTGTVTKPGNTPEPDDPNETDNTTPNDTQPKDTAPDTTGPSNEPDSEFPVGLVVGIAVAAVVVIGGAVIAVVLVKKKKKN